MQEGLISRTNAFENLKEIEKKFVESWMWMGVKIFGGSVNVEYEISREQFDMFVEFRIFISRLMAV